MTDFDAPRIKIRQAERHLVTLHDLLAPYLAENPKITRRLIPGSIFQTDMMSFDAAPSESAAVVGDVIHNLRAALDIVACEMAERKSGSSDKVRFPFSKDAEKFPRAVKESNFELCGLDAMSVLQALKPYPDGDGLFYAIHALDIMDKHRALLPHPKGNMKFGAFRALPNPDGTTSVFAVHGQDQRSLKLTFAPKTGLAGKDLFVTLRQMIERTNTALDRFAALNW